MRLTEDKVKVHESQDGILPVLPELKYELHTTRTPAFLEGNRAVSMTTRFPEPWRDLGNASMEDKTVSQMVSLLGVSDIKGILGMNHS